jgi:hypothetical protein
MLDEPLNRPVDRERSCRICSRLRGRCCVLEDSWREIKIGLEGSHYRYICDGPKSRHGREYSMNTIVSGHLLEESQDDFKEYSTSANAELILETQKLAVKMKSLPCHPRLCSNYNANVHMHSLPLIKSTFRRNFAGFQAACVECTSYTLLPFAMLPNKTLKPLHKALMSG